MVIYTGGYPHRALQNFLRKLSDSLLGASGGTEICHWGDIDLGGIRIFEYLKAQFFPHLSKVLLSMKIRGMASTSTCRRPGKDILSLRNNGRVRAAER
ncbi:Wadjet anti-phage system protein JetD domain-containing protein [Thermicanus aegyptius]|uniref:Wadjet anti-phage system protein JetD domain-containing protein n=1 Tax=Thermicanus aegyptius TaxID=94009 RepID=UPI001B7FEE85